MGYNILNSHTWLRTMYIEPFSIIYFIISITTINFVASQQPETNCILNIQPLSNSNNPSCERGDWGGFLNKDCCGSVFDGYLYALGRRANQTGQIYLNSSEQANCLTSMKKLEGDIFGCGIEKLTSGAGGCSDFSVDNVGEIFGDQLKSLDENCKLASSNGDSKQTCDPCVRSWVDIRGTHSISSDPQSIKAENDICRFAVLVCLTSRIEDETYAQKIYQCLAEQTNNSDNQAPEDKRKFKNSTGVWILIGGLIVVAVTVFSATCILLRRCRKSNQPPKTPAFKNVRLKKSGCQKFPIKEVYSATNNLNQLNFIGEGTAGKVYKGVLSNNQHVAIKHIINDGNVETFVREVASLSDVRHPNLVALLGYCVRHDEGFLVYELCPNGNLSEWLFGKDKVLSWIQRLEIAIQSARGLTFLHSYSEGCIVHRDIKPTNILLGPKFEAKLSDFGLSKVIDLGETYVSSEVRGTFGYVDPEYQSDRQVNASGDVYSFGIVLLQILSGKRVINLNVKKPMPLDKMAKAFTKGGSTEEFVDPKLDGEYSAEAFDLTLKLALTCTALKQQRPSMEQVVVTLEKALDISSSAKASSTPETTPDHPSIDETVLNS